ncbi:unnamed protein product [Moneuplotes crassus]|uniref:Uncharacterized protein n=1 Tax=Euplotes crassus TaxID=5936 RepID=A0AAD2CWT2_EUPCR|nr:unnamed protein product [Moneuplotes crassus]
MDLLDQIASIPPNLFSLTLKEELVFFQTLADSQQCEIHPETLKLIIIQDKNVCLQETLAQMYNCHLKKLKNVYFPLWTKLSTRFKKVLVLQHRLFKQKDIESWKFAETKIKIYELIEWLLELSESHLLFKTYVQDFSQHDLEIDLYCEKSLAQNADVKKIVDHFLNDMKKSNSIIWVKNCQKLIENTTYNFPLYTKKEVFSTLLDLWARNHPLFRKSTFDLPRYKIIEAFECYDPSESNRDYEKDQPVYNMRYLESLIIQAQYDLLLSASKSFTTKFWENPNKAKTKSVPIKSELSVPVSFCSETNSPVFNRKSTDIDSNVFDLQE